MAAFIVVGSGLLDLRSTDIIGFDGITFQTNGNLRVQLKTSQFGLLGLQTDSIFTGSGFRDIIEVFLDDGSTFVGSSFTLAGWSTQDSFLFRDSIFNENITGTQGNDTFSVTGGFDFVDGNLGVDDILVANYGFLTNSMFSAGGSFTNFSGTGVSYANIDRFDLTLGSGNDNITTGAGFDTVRGGAGNDEINTATGRAVVDGGTGTDLWRADFSGDATAKVVDVRLLGVQNAGNGTTYDGFERLGITGGNGDDIFSTRTDNANDGLADTLNGGGGNDTLTVGGGFDQERRYLVYQMIEWLDEYQGHRHKF